MRLGARTPTPHEEAAVRVLSCFLRIYMYGNGLVVFGVFLGWFGVFRGRRFSKRNLAHYMYGDGLVVFGVFWVGLGYFEAVGFQKKKFSALYVRCILARPEDTSSRSLAFRPLHHG